MGHSKSRTITILVTITSITSNTFSSLLSHNLPDDPYRLASSFGWYLHFANILSVVGLVGAIRQHALSIAIFSNYLLLDTILFSIPRFLVLGLLQQMSTSICASTSEAFPHFGSHTITSTISSSSSANHDRIAEYELANGLGLGSYTEGWTRDGCVRVVELVQLTLVAGVVAATLLQFVGALWIRDYARGLWIREWRDEESRMVLAAHVEELLIAEDDGVEDKRDDNARLVEKLF